jgi:hypothetical protein
MTAIRLLAALGWLLIVTGAASGEAVQSRFPLRVSPDHRHLLTAAGEPLFIEGDAGWSLIAELTREETELYLADRKRRGFNALLVNLVEHRFSSNPPRNAYGDAPFGPDGAFRDLGDSYFRHAAWVLERAEQEGFVVFLAPAYLGVGGGEEGWYRDVEAAGEGAMRAYGRAIATRFADRRNIIWVHGGDFDVPHGSEPLVRAVVDGIKSVSPESLHTVHGGRDTIPSESWGPAEWLSIDTVYTFDDTYERIVSQAQGEPPRPVLLIEGAYENERDTTEEGVRRQAYAALLGGSAGQVFGNNPVWHFGSSGVFASDQSWTEALSSRGAQSVTNLASLVQDLPWWTIVPGAGCAELTAGDGAFVGCSPDGAVAVGYLYSTDSVLVNAPSDVGQTLTYRWYDPSDGAWVGEAVAMAAGAPSLRVEPPAPLNAGGFSDWVLVVRR